MAWETFNNIEGIEDLIVDLKRQGVGITAQDVAIAGVIFSLYGDTVIRGYEDMDGIIVRDPEAYIYNEQIASLIQAFPNAAKILSSLDRKKNRGFIDPNGELYEVGLMGSKNPFAEIREMIEAYQNNGYVKLDYGRGEYRNKKKLYNSEREFRDFQREQERRMSPSRPSNDRRLIDFNYNYNYDYNEGYGGRRR